MNDSALLRATSSKVRENPFLTDSDRRDGQDVVGRTFIPGMAPAGGQAAVGGGRWDLRQGPLPPAGEDAGDDGRQPAAEGCGLAYGAWAAAVEATWRPTGGGDPGRAGGRAERVGGLLLHRRERDRGRDPRDGRRPVLAGDHLPRLQRDRRGRPAAGAVRVGKHRCIPHLPLDVHDDRGLGLGPGGGRVGGPPRVTVGRSRTGARAMRTSAGRGAANCWRRKFVRFYAPGSPRRKFRPSPSGCSTWPHHTEGTYEEWRRSYMANMGA